VWGIEGRKKDGFDRIPRTVPGVERRIGGELFIGSARAGE
jgi:hypothetical protein